MTHIDHIMIGLMVGALGVLWKLGSDGMAQVKTLRASHREIERAISDTESEKADVEEETEHLREVLGESVTELEKLKLEYDQLMQRRIARN